MLLRATLVILFMLNLGAAAWWALRPALADGGAAHATAAGAPGLRLVDEPLVAAVPAPAPSQPAAAAPTMSPVPIATPEPASTTAAVCLRFGPFADGPARSARGWKVAMPPLASREEAVAMAERIKAAGISDLYVMNEGADANSIALGRYGGEDAARRREAELRGKGFAAQATPLGDTPSQAWLDARLPTAVTPASLAAIAPSRGIDCTTLR